ncbi:MAG: alkaline phosphatase family protein [Bacteroidetes bacterium]|nr:alkaline phosphatase family protein [Bacteroidota bacterium]
MPAHTKHFLSLTLFLAFLVSCRHDKPVDLNFKTEKVVILVIDGPRYSETYGDPTHQYIPHLANDLAPQGVVSESFRNNGPTYTTAGHTAITTGFYQEINNAGAELPLNPSLFQYYLMNSGKDSTAAWIIASKDKLEILGNTAHADWENRYLPATDCGLNGAGVGSGYRHDSLTYIRTTEILSTYHPNLVLINFREPDYSGHQNNWTNYLQGIIDTDTYAWKLWNFLQADPYYTGTTSLFITNDHGRHLDGVSSGFSGHGDDCEGCRHINFFAAGPDFKQNFVSTTQHELTDIPATIAYMFEFRMATADGEIMHDLFK